VIVIEDEPVVRMLLEETLAELGYTSAAFDNASVALSHLVDVQGDCALIIADQGLPGGMQGLEFIRTANEQWPIIPTILTSGYEIEKQTIPPGTTYLRKPYTLGQLENTIATKVNGTLS
jgi:CheY-like chemotaxis protein